MKSSYKLVVLLLLVSFSVAFCTYISPTEFRCDGSFTKGGSQLEDSEFTQECCSSVGGTETYTGNYCDVGSYNPKDTSGTSKFSKFINCCFDKKPGESFLRIGERGRR